MHPFALRIFIKDLDGRLLVSPFDDFRDFDLVDITEERSFSLDFAFGEVELVHSSCKAIGAVAGIGKMFLRYPGMCQALVYGNALVHVDCEHAIYEIQGWVAN